MFIFLSFFAQTAFQAFGLVSKKVSARQDFGGKENRSLEECAPFIQKMHLEWAKMEILCS